MFVLTVLGTVIALMGTAVWAVTTAVFEPAMSSLYRSWADEGGVNYGRFSADGINALFAFFKDLRWAAIALAIAGVLLLLDGSRWRGRLLTATAVSWFGVDLVLDRLDVTGWLSAVAAGVAVAAGLICVVLLGRRHDEGPPEYRPTTIVYSGALIGLAALFAPGVTDDLAPHVPAGAVGTAEAVVAALAFAAVIGVATAVAPPSRARLIVTAVLAPLAAVAGFVNVRLLGDPSLAYGSSGLRLYGIFGLLPIALALLAGALHRRRMIAIAVCVVASPVAAAMGMIMFVVGGVWGMGVMNVTGDAPPRQVLDWAFGGLTGGAICGALAVLVRAISRGDPPAELDPDRPPTERHPLHPSPTPFLPMS